MKKLLIIAISALAIGMFLVACDDGGGGGGCKSNSDCVSQGTNYYCNLTSGDCECAPQCTGKCGGTDGCGGTCTSNCPAGTTCNQTTFVCEGSGCTTDNDCGAGQSCLNGTCVVTGCTSDAECSTGQVCQNGTCVTSGCTSDNDCATGQTCQQGTCVASGCTSDNDCPTGQTCQEGSCVASGCTSDNDCPTGQVCTNGYCVASGCTSDNDCPTGQTCNNGTCVASGCTSDNDCLTGQTCQNGTCVASGCTSDNDCPTGQVCTNGSCVAESGGNPGDACNCDANTGTCTIPCGANATAGCIIIDTPNPGDGFCSNSCTTDGECTGIPAFAGGCCLEITGGSVCVEAAYCPGSQTEGQPCAWETVNASAGACDTGLACLGNDGSTDPESCSTAADCSAPAGYNSDCVNGVCGFSFCSAPCGAGDTCNTGFGPASVGGECFCIPVEVGNAQGGEQCQSTPTPDADACDTGLSCWFTETDSFCSHSCGTMADCTAAGFSGGCCVDATGEGDVICLPAAYCE